MNILLVSDDHGIDGFEAAFECAVAEYDIIDMVIHAGDTESHNMDKYRKICGCDFYAVKGNNDYNDCSDAILVNAAEHKIFVTHGHRYNVYAGMEKLYFAALEKGADIAVFGHTHRPFHDNKDSVEMINPGSLTLPRGSRFGSCAVLTIDEAGTTNVEFITLN